MERGDVLRIEGLSVRYGSKGPFAVSDVSFSLARGERLGLVGASGCGKSSLARAIVGLEDAAAGRVLWHPAECAPWEDVATLPGPRLRAYRRDVQLVFQDTLGALNPRQRVGEALSEVLFVHARDRFPTRRTRAARVRELLDRVELSSETADRFPHEISGGQRQRVGIARALAVEPSVLLADEPVSALDVAVRVQVLHLLFDLSERDGLSLLFVSHDLSVVRCLCSRVLVMERGRLVEQGPVETVFHHPQDPFTKTLLEAVPRFSHQPSHT